MRIALSICFLVSGCASWGYQARKDRQRVAELEKQVRELRTKQARSPSPTPSPVKGEGKAATAPPPVPPAPPVPGPRSPAPIAAVPWPYPDQGAGFLARTPNGWGPSPLSVRIVNAATREIHGSTPARREPFCYLGIELDDQQVMFNRPDWNVQAVPLIGHVKEGLRPRTIALIPPGRSAYVILDEPGRHHIRARCYVGPPKPFRIGEQTIPVLQLYSEWEADLENPQDVWVSHFSLRAITAGGRFD